MFTLNRNSINHNLFILLFQTHRLLFHTTHPLCSKLTLLYLLCDTETLQNSFILDQPPCYLASLMEIPKEDCKKKKKKGREWTLDFFFSYSFSCLHYFSHHFPFCLSILTPAAAVGSNFQCIVPLCSQNALIKLHNR